ncbi:MAG TPA: serine hydrolase, partial [Cyclobacteriaceae bacterium]|nr:serine hydrolase [Cyclobacteriaceae bacterium]
IENGKPDTTTNENSTQFLFSGNEVGEISMVALKLEPTLAPLEFKRTPIKVDVSTADLKRYEGEFELGGMTVRFFTKADVLRLFVPGQPEYELVPTGKHKFMLKGLE